MGESDEKKRKGKGLLGQQRRKRDIRTEMRKTKERSDKGKIRE